jgi:hypothetical protein
MSQNGMFSCKLTNCKQNQSSGLETITTMWKTTKCEMYYLQTWLGRWGELQPWNTHSLYRWPNENKINYQTVFMTRIWHSHPVKIIHQRKNQTDMAWNWHSHTVEVAHQREGPSAKSNGFPCTKLTLTSCRGHTPKGRTLSKIKQTSWHEIGTHAL